MISYLHILSYSTAGVRQVINDSLVCCSAVGCLAASDYGRQVLVDCQGRLVGTIRLRQYP